MKTKLLLSFLTMSVFCQAQQIDLNGIVTIHNSKYRTGKIQYVENTQVSAAFTIPDGTDDKGTFSLTFVGLEGGTKIDLTAEKEGLQVVNSHDLSNVVIGRKDPIKVAMDTKGRLAQSQTEFYNISKKALYAEYERKMSILEKDGEEKDQLLTKLSEEWNQDIKEKNEAIEELKKQLADAEKRLPEFAKDLAYVNLDFAADFYIEAFELFKAGKVRESIAFLTDAKLEQAAADAFRAIEIGKELTARGKEQVGHVIESYQLKADAYNLYFEYQKAAAVYQKIIDLLEIVDPDDSIELARAYLDLGNIYHSMGLYQKALGFKQKGTVTAENVLRKDDLELCLFYKHLAINYQDIPNLQKALETQQKSLNIQEQVLNADDGAIAVSYTVLAGIYRDMGQYETALETQQKAVAIQEKIATLDDKELADSYSSLSSIYQFLGDLEKSLTFQLKVIDIQEKILDPNDPKLGTAYNNLGTTYLDLEDFDNAMIAAKKSLAIRKKVLPANHPLLAHSHNLIALVYMSTGDFENALIEQQKDIYITEQTLNYNHPDLAYSYTNLSTLHYYMGNLQEAIKTQQKATKIAESVFEPDHPQLEVFFASLASFYQFDKDYTNAVIFYKKMVEINPNQPNIWNTIGSCYANIKEYEKAILNYNEFYRRDSTNRWAWLNNTGLVYAKMGNFKKAKKHFSELQELKPDDGFVYRDWAMYYALQGKKKKALDNLEKAVQLGYTKLSWISTDDSLDSIRGEDRYKKVINQLEASEDN